MVSYNPACYLPSSLTSYIPQSIACPPPPSYWQSTYATLTSPFGATITTLKTGMDAIISLPFLSFLLIPTMTSYSTSLNILFFYLTWSTLVLSHSPLKVEIIGSLAVRILFYVIPSSLFLAFDILLPSFSKSFKSLGTTALPIQDFSSSKTPKHLKTLAWSLFNILFAIAIQAIFEYTLTTILNHRSALKVTTTLPLPWAIAKDLLRGLLLRDLLTYIIHRNLLHYPHLNSLTRDLSSLHHSWYHSAVKAPFPLSPTYDHPLIHLLRSSIPTYLPAYLWRFHLLTYILYLSIISLEEALTHSGYSHLPTHFVLGGIARRNDLHCLSGGVGNYGTWGLADWVFGTSIGGDVARDLVDEVREEQDEIKETVKRGVRRVAGLRKGEGKMGSSASGSSEGVERVKKRTKRVGRSDGEVVEQNDAVSMLARHGSGSEAGRTRQSRRRRSTRTRKGDSDYESG